MHSGTQTKTLQSSLHVIMLSVSLLQVKKTAAVLDSTSDSGHASDGTDHLESNAAAGAAVIRNKNGRVRL